MLCWLASPGYGQEQTVIVLDATLNIGDEMKEVGRWHVTGDDGMSYIVVKREGLGRPFQMDGVTQLLPGRQHFALLSGERLGDDATGYWEIEGSGVRIKKPEDL